MIGAGVLLLSTFPPPGSTIVEEEEVHGVDVEPSPYSDLPDTAGGVSGDHDNTQSRRNGVINDGT